jgi:plastocyanin
MEVQTLHRTTSTKQNHKLRYLAIAVVAVLLAGVVGFAAYAQLSTMPAPNVSMTIYGGTNQIQYGFSFDTRIDTPGPTLTFKVGDVVNMTFINIDPRFPHDWALVDSRSRSAHTLFDSRTPEVQVGANASVVFRVSKAGNFYYACMLSGDIAYGMWGNVIVNP